MTLSFYISTLHIVAPVSGIIISGKSKWFNLSKPVIEAGTWDCWLKSLATRRFFIRDEEACRLHAIQVISMNSHQMAICRIHVSHSPINYFDFLMVHHDSIAVSTLLLLLPATELQATELALARTCLSLFPKTSFTATQIGDCLHISLPETSTAGIAWWASWSGMEILSWCGLRAFPLFPE